MMNDENWRPDADEKMCLMRSLDNILGENWDQVMRHNALRRVYEDLLEREPDQHGGIIEIGVDDFVLERPLLIWSLRTLESYKALECDFHFHNQRSRKRDFAWIRITCPWKGETDLHRPCLNKGRCGAKARREIDYDNDYLD